MIDQAPPLPNRTAVVVIGGGIIGVSAAYFLAKRGIPVLLLEKGRLAGEQSSRNWGFVRQQGRDPAELPTIMESLRLWRGLEAEIGESVGFKQAGVLYMADDEDTEHRFQTWLDLARQYQLDTRMLSAAEIRSALPGATGRWRSALTTPSDARAEPSLAVPALARAAQRLGVEIREGCAVRGLDLAGGRVTAVVTEAGRVGCDAALLAAGAWSGVFCSRHGIRLPQLKVRGSVFRTGPAPLITDRAVWCMDVAFRRRADGGYTVAHGGVTDHPVTPATFRYLRQFWPSFRAERKRLHLRLDRRFWTELTMPRRWAMDQASPFERNRTLDPEPNRKLLAEAKANLVRLFPQLKDVTVAEQWAGMIDVTPDAVPVIGPVAETPGLFIATGFSGHGFGIGPGAGKLASELVSGAPTCVDPSPFRLARFGDARPADPQPAP